MTCIILQDYTGFNKQFEIHTNLGLLQAAVLLYTKATCPGYRHNIVLGTARVGLTKTGDDGRAVNGGWEQE